MIIRTQIRFALTTLITAALLAPASYALKLEEIVVTAQKREQSLQDVAIAISAFSADRLEKNNITDLSRLDQFTPGITFGASGADARPTVRGVPTPSLQIDADPSLGFHIDGAYRTRTGQALAAMFDVERVEVHRGPQGTLFGRNTTGGNVNILSKAPQDAFEARISTGYGNYDHIYLEGMLNTPLSESLQARLALKYEKHNPYAENVFLGGNHGANDKDQTVGRLSLRFVPSDDFVALLRVSLWDQGGQSSFNGYKSGGAQLADGITLADVPDKPLGRGTKADFLSPTGTATQVYNPNGGGLFPNLTDPTKFSSNLPNTYDLEETSVNLTMHWNLAAVRLTSVTSYSDYDADRSGDADFSALDASGIHFFTESQTFQQEVHLSSTEVEPLEWVVGVYYLNDEGSDLFRLFGLSVPDTEVFFDRHRDAATDSWAVFGQASHALSDTLRLTLGARYTQDDKVFDQLQQNGPRRGSAITTDTRGNNDTRADTFEKVTWRVGLDKNLRDENLIYATVSTGYRSGGFNNISSNPNVPATFGPETVLAFEIGSKNTLFDENLLLNLSLYHATYEDAHALSFDAEAQASYTRNAAEVIAYGLEYEATALVSESLRLSAVGHFMDASYATYEGCVDNFTGAVLDCTGNEIERSPAIKFSLSAEYDIALSGGGAVTPRVAMTYTGDYHNTQFNYDIDAQEAFTRTDASVTWTSASGRLSVRAYVNNIEDEVPLTYAVVGSAGTLFAQYTAPRTWGIRFNYDYR